MKLQHLISVDAIVKHDFNLTRAAAALNASQPALTMHVKLLEAELRTQLFIRERSRFVGLSAAGRSLLPIAARAADAARELKRTAKEFQEPSPDALTVAAAQTLARYVLPPVIERFCQVYPKTKLRIRHGPMPQLVGWVASGEADLSVSTRPKHPPPAMLSLPCYDLGWLLVTKPEHPLLARPTLTLAELAEHPLITYDETFTSHGILLEAFRAEGLTPNVVVMGNDSDIMKRFVRSGIGVAIVKDGAFDPGWDHGLAARKLDGVLPSTPVEVTVRRNAPLSKAAFAFVNIIQPKLATSLRRRLAVPYR